MEGISTRCSFHALFPALVGLRLAVVGVGLVATNAMILVAEVWRVETKNPLARVGHRGVVAFRFS